MSASCDRAWRSPSHHDASASSLGSTRPPGKTWAPPMNAVPSWRRTMKTSGPAELSRSTTTVAAGRGFAGTFTADHISRGATALVSFVLSSRVAAVMATRSSSMDMNGTIAALLRDFAAIQKSKQSMWGYKRAAAAVLALEEPIESLLQPDGTLRKIPNIGPSSSRVILEVLQTGTSPTVERAIAESGQSTDIERRRDLRGHFLSRSRVLAAFRNRQLVGPRLDDYNGDLQMHSTWSDGSQSLEDIVLAGIERGYQFCGVTDHSYGLPIAGGVSMEELAQQHREIDALNRKYRRRFRLIKGIEANIRADGSVDMQPEEL